MLWIFATCDHIMNRPQPYSIRFIVVHPLRGSIVVSFLLWFRSRQHCAFDTDGPWWVFFVGWLSLPIYCFCFSHWLLMLDMGQVEARATVEIDDLMCSQFHHWPRERKREKVWLGLLEVNHSNNSQHLHQPISLFI